MSTFDDFLAALRTGIVQLAQDTVIDFKDQAIQDGEDFLQQTKDDLQRWTNLLAQGQLTRDDFQFLVVSKRDLAEMHALTQAGLALVAIQTFRDGLINLVINTAFDILLP